MFGVGFVTKYPPLMVAGGVVTILDVMWSSYNGINNVGPEAAYNRAQLLIEQAEGDIDLARQSGLQDNETLLELGLTPEHLIELGLMPPPDEQDDQNEDDQNEESEGFVDPNVGGYSIKVEPLGSNWR